MTNQESQSFAQVCRNGSLMRFRCSGGASEGKILSNEASVVQHWRSIASRRLPWRMAAPVVLALLSIACSHRDDAGREAKKTVPAAGYVVLKQDAVPLRLELAGRTAAFEASEVRPQVSGIIQARLFTE